MFHIRLENTDAHTMTDNEIKSARIIAYNAERLSDTAAHMLNINRAILNGNHINLTRAARNIARIHNLLTQCWGEVDSLHECYLAQYTDLTMTAITCATFQTLIFRNSQYSTTALFTFGLQQMLTLQTPCLILLKKSGIH